MRFFSAQAQRRRFDSGFDRRQFLATMGVGGLFFTSRGAFAQALVQTPAQTIGPYYPDKLPLDLDNDLLVINDSITPAMGQITWITGRVLDNGGQPVRNALVEIWQADNNGAYIHSQSPSTNRDAGFQGYGKFLTASGGEYLFRTVKPGLYPGRTRHVHMQITAPDGQKLVTQLYVQGEALNTNDSVLTGIRDTAQRASVVVAWTAVEGSKIGELVARFDIVFGFTPAENSTPARPTLVSMVHGASLQAGAAAGSWVTIFGQGLSSTTRTWGASDIVNLKLPESLDGVSVSIDNKPASVYYVSPKQINVQAPDDTSSGQVQVTVTNGSETSTALKAELQPVLPGFFTLAQDYVIAVRPDGSYAGPAGLVDGLTTRPAQPNEVLSLFGTGFGPASSPTPAGQGVAGPSPLANNVKIQIDTIQADVRYAGHTGVGLDQFNIVVPDLLDGDHAVSAQVGTARTRRIGRLRIQRG